MNFFIQTCFISVSFEQLVSWFKMKALSRRLFKSNSIPKKITLA